MDCYIIVIEDTPIEPVILSEPVILRNGSSCHPCVDRVLNIHKRLSGDCDALAEEIRPELLPVDIFVVLLMHQRPLLLR